MVYSHVRSPDAQHPSVRPAVNRIEFLYFDGCPGEGEALQMLKEALRAERVMAEIQMYRLETDREASTSRFPGSPTIRVNGRDIVESSDLVVGLSCRTYRKSDGKMSAVPPRDKLLDALRSMKHAATVNDIARGAVGGPTRYG